MKIQDFNLVCDEIQIARLVRDQPRIIDLLRALSLDMTDEVASCIENEELTVVGLRIRLGRSVTLAGPEGNYIAIARKG
jgi:hypothetical protein